MKIARLKEYWKPTILAVISATLYTLAFPGGALPWLGWVCMVPIMVPLYMWGRRKSTYMWMVYGIVFWTTSTKWLAVYMGYVLEMPTWLWFSLLVIMMVLCALPYGITAYVVSRWKWMRIAVWPFLLAALLALLVEFVPVPFPGDLSMSMYRQPVMVQIADIGGGHFVHFVMILVNGLIAQIGYSIYKKKGVPKWGVAALVLIMAGVVGYGMMRLSEYEEKYANADESKMVRIGYVQSNIPGAYLTEEYGKYMEEREWLNTVRTTLETTKELIKTPGLDAIFWPEAPDDVPYYQLDWVRKGIDEVVKQANAPLLLPDIYPWKGYVTTTYMTGYNALYYINTDGKLTTPYHKMKLIPFAEYLPGEEMFPFLRAMFPRIGQVTAGKEPVALEINERLRLIPFICYDGIFPSFVRRNIAKTGGNLMVSLDNDVNFGPTKAALVHFSVMYYRAIEHRMPLIRVNNNRDCFVVLSNGVIPEEWETTPYKREYRAVDLLPGDESESTIYQSGGFLATPVLFGLALLAIKFRRRLGVEDAA